jgi:hypothetical protein
LERKEWKGASEYGQFRQDQLDDVIKLGDVILNVGKADVKDHTTAGSPDAAKKSAELQGAVSGSTRKRAKTPMESATSSAPVASPRSSD